MIVGSARVKLLQTHTKQKKCHKLVANCKTTNRRRYQGSNLGFEKIAIRISSDNHYTIAPLSRLDLQPNIMTTTFFHLGLPCFLLPTLHELCRLTHRIYSSPVTLGTTTMRQHRSASQQRLMRPPQAYSDLPVHLPGCYKNTKETALSPILAIQRMNHLSK